MSRFYCTSRATPLRSPPLTDRVGTASHWVGILALGALIPVAGSAAPFGLLAMTTLVLVLVAAWDKLMTGGSA